MTALLNEFDVAQIGGLIMSDGVRDLFRDAMADYSKIPGNVKEVLTC